MRNCRTNLIAAGACLVWSLVHGDEPTTGSRGATGGAWTCESRIRPGALICSVPRPGICGGREHSKITNRATQDLHGEAHNEREAVAGCTPILQPQGERDGKR